MDPKAQGAPPHVFDVRGDGVPTPEGLPEAVVREPNCNLQRSSTRGGTQFRDPLHFRPARGLPEARIQTRLAAQRRLTEYQPRPPQPGVTGITPGLEPTIHLFKRRVPNVAPATTQNMPANEKNLRSVLLRSKFDGLLCTLRANVDRQ